jgi:5'-3' exonuclease
MGKSNPEINVETGDLLEIPEFITKYKQTFLTTIEKIMKRHNMSFKDLIFLRDCSGANIWRKQIFPEYKGNRDYTNFNGKTLFQWSYDNLLPIYIEKGARVIRFEDLEADDTGAIIVRWMTQHRPSEKIVIITNDNDYLQLLQYPNVTLINLKEEDLIKRSLGNPLRDLMKKIILGDKSDNIPKVFERCGEKTLLKYIDDPLELETALNKNSNYRKQYNLNRLLIDFNKIPNIYVEDVLNWCQENLKI